MRSPFLFWLRFSAKTYIYQSASACYLWPLLVHTWAPRGQTPLILEHDGRAHLSLIAAVALNGRLYVAVPDQAFTSADIVWFSGKHCSRYRKRDLLVILPGRRYEWGFNSS